MSTRPPNFVLVAQGHSGRDPNAEHILDQVERMLDGIEGRCRETVQSEIWNTESKVDDLITDVHNVNIMLKEMKPILENFAAYMQLLPQPDDEEESI